VAIQARLRRGEILGLQWQDIDFVSRSVHIEQTLVKTNEGNILKPPKTKDSQSATALSPATVEALRQRMIAQARECKAWEDQCGPGSWKDTGLVFTREDGHHLKPDSFARQFKKRLGQSRVPRIRFHDQRHTAATLMVDAGTDIKVVSNQLRHADISTTAELYVGPIPEAQRRAADAMDEVLGLSDRSKSARIPKESQRDVQ
jgi:integrase